MEDPMAYLFDDLLDDNSIFLGERMAVDENTDMDFLFAQALQQAEEESWRQLREIEEKDAKLAKQLLEEEQKKLKYLNNVEEEDRKFILSLLHSEDQEKKKEENLEFIQTLQEDMITEEKRKRKKIEEEDEKIAKSLAKEEVPSKVFMFDDDMDMERMHEDKKKKLESDEQLARRLQAEFQEAEKKQTEESKRAQQQKDEEMARKLQQDMDLEKPDRLNVRDERDRVFTERDRELAERTVRVERDRELAERTAREERDRVLAERTVRVERDRELAERTVRVERDRELAERTVREERDRELAERTMREERDWILAEKTLWEDQDLILAEKTFREEQDREMALKLEKELEKEREDAEVARKLQEQYQRERHQSRIKEQRKREKEEQEAKAKLEAETNFGHISEAKRYVTDLSLLNNLLKTYPGCELRRVIKPNLKQRFEELWVKFQYQYGKGSDLTSPKIAFHGTKSQRMSSIENKGLLVPGNAGVTHATDSGWYGRGIYLSPNPSLSLGYSDDGRLIICAILLGKTFKCMNRMDGAGLQPGCDSHMSPDGQELVLFNAGQVLPLFVLNTRPIK